MSVAQGHRTVIILTANSDPRILLIIVIIITYVHSELIGSEGWIGEALKRETKNSTGLLFFCHYMFFIVSAVLL